MSPHWGLERDPVHTPVTVCSKVVDRAARGPGGFGWDLGYCSHGGFGDAAPPHKGTYVLWPLGVSVQHKEQVGRAPGAGDGAGGSSFTVKQPPGHVVQGQDSPTEGTAGARPRDSTLLHAKGAQGLGAAGLGSRGSGCVDLGGLSSPLLWRPHVTASQHCPGA